MFSIFYTNPRRDIIDMGLNGIDSLSSLHMQAVNHISDLKTV